jgi:hypothetical protein
MTPFGIEPATFQFVAQYLNHCATAVPRAIPLLSLMAFVAYEKGEIYLPISAYN